MTGPDSQDTRPISVAELLARNGTIGAPPVGGRRRRRRGNSDAVTVAELTGEIPIIRPDEEPAAEAPETMKTAEETAEVLGISVRTVHREWDLARAWLFRELRGGEPYPTTS